MLLLTAVIRVLDSNQLSPLFSELAWGCFSPSEGIVQGLVSGNWDMYLYRGRLRRGGGVGFF